MSDWPLIEQNFRVDLAGSCVGRPKDQGTDIVNRKEVLADCAILAYAGPGSFDRQLHRTDLRDKRRSL
jgi:hypothetical protein